MKEKINRSNDTLVVSATKGSSSVYDRNEMVHILVASLLLVFSPTTGTTGIRSDLSAIIARGGLVEESLEETNGNDEGQHRKLTSRPIVICKWKTYPGLYYFGDLITIHQQVDTKRKCSTLCHNYNKTHPETCRSANFFKSRRSCELMEGVLNVNDQNSLATDAEMIPEATWLLPTGCIEQMGPEEDDSATTETDTPDDWEPEENVTTTTPIGHDQETTQTESAELNEPTEPTVQQLRCGQTFVTPRFSVPSMQNSGARIVGGIESRPHSLPWMVSLQRSNDGPLQHFCAASLIRVSEAEESDILISAGHCFFAEEPDDLEAVAGMHNLRRKRIAPGIQRVKGSKWVVHENYDDDKTIFDISIVKLETPIKFTNTVQPVCLPGPGEVIQQGMLGIVSGWGSFYYGGLAHDTLTQLVVPVVNTSKCDYNYRHAENQYDYTEILPDIMFCAGYWEGDRDTCQGDSGGPLIFNSSRGWVLRGLVSFGPNGCALKDLPGIYTRVSYFLNWIRDKVKKLSSLVNENDV